MLSKVKNGPKTPYPIGGKNLLEVVFDGFPKLKLDLGFFLLLQALKPFQDDITGYCLLLWLMAWPFLFF